MCYFCGCDSSGNPANNGAYIPSGVGDSSGIQPNLAFEINGTDYFTTGNIRYQGTTNAGSDSTNRWVKKGFVYKTGLAETSFVLGIRNNAPGGGGNDWAIDDIALATCLPNMSYSPSLTPSVCRLNPLTVYDTVRSYFNNYIYYKWQRSTDNGVTWTDVTGALGPVTPVQVGSVWQYVSSYTIPPANADTSDNGDRYRLITSTTSANLSNANCQATDGVNIINLVVNNCGVPLKTDLLSFNGRLINDYANLAWVTSREDEPLIFDIERSNDGINFTRIGSVNSHTDPALLNNYYSFVDHSAIITNKALYRIVLTDQQSNKKISRMIQLNTGHMGFGINNVINPFTDKLLFDVFLENNRIIEVTLADIFGKPIKKKSYVAYAGVNSMQIDNTGSLASGTYILQVKDKERVISKKVLKR